MITASYARICMRNGKVGLHLVSEKGHEFVLYDKQILSMANNPAKYRRVKHRNSREKEAIGYYAGEIWGMFEDYKVGCHAKVTICIGPNGEDIERDEMKRPINLAKKMAFYLPIGDFKKFVGVLELMKSQKDLFKELLECAEMEVDVG